MCTHTHSCWGICVRGKLMSGAWLRWGYKREGWMPYYCRGGFPWSPQVPSVINCDTSSSSTPSDLTAVPPPPPPPPPLSQVEAHAMHISSMIHTAAEMQPQYSATGHRNRASLMEYLTLIHAQHTHTQKPSWTVWYGCINLGNPNKHALSVNGCMYLVTTPSVQLLHVIQPQLKHHHINNNYPWFSLCVNMKYLYSQHPQQGKGNSSKVH